MRVIVENSVFDRPAGKVICVGRNYVEHVAELQNVVPDEPILFIKPVTSLVPFQQDIVLPTFSSDVHYELELALLIGKEMKAVSEEAVCDSVAAVGLALDLTARDLQNRLKSKGHPWEIAKAFDGACPLTHFVTPPVPAVWSDFHFTLEKNGDLQQRGQVDKMIFSIPHLLSYMSRFFTLERGDVVLTGTPAGVGPLHASDTLKAALCYRGDVFVTAQTKVI
ncbi:Homoprotocatechuate catabolism bifunctional isomerase/decarboxylase [Thalassocella blandensis]|nr:Homoprotocatechuate catabolism bifunctional isomerase/decarboxylase [Thalassocella blandensis]